MRPKQGTFAEASFERRRKCTWREDLMQMDTVVPWQKLTALIEPVYPSGEGAGRPPIGLERLPFVAPAIACMIWKGPKI